MMFLLSALFLFRHEMPLGGGTADIAKLGIGYFLWSGSMFVAFLLSVAFLKFPDSVTENKALNRSRESDVI